MSRFFRKRKVCQFCRSQSGAIDYTNVHVLRGYIDNRARIKNRRRTGVCSKHQRELARAVKIARQMALLPCK